MSAVTGRPTGVPPPEALDPQPRFMPDGSLDWHWYLRQKEILEAWWDAGLCVNCGERPMKEGWAVCGTRECESTPRPKWAEGRDECHFCGNKYGRSSVGSGSFGGPTTPVNVQYCPKCGGRRPPSGDEAVGQGRLFE